MAKLRIYTVHVNPSLTHPYEGAEFVAEGFNWRAFVFTWIWALYNRQWLPALGLFFYSVFMLNLFYSGTFSHFGVSVIDFGSRLIIGYQANEWLRKKLGNKGYLTVDITTGDSPLRAEQRFFDRYIAAHPGASAY